MGLLLTVTVLTSSSPPVPLWAIVRSNGTPGLSAVKTTVLALASAVISANCGIISAFQAVASAAIRVVVFVPADVAETDLPPCVSVT